MTANAVYHEWSRRCPQDVGVRPIRAALRPTAAVAGGCLALLAAAGAAGAAPDPDPDPPATSTTSTTPTTPTTAGSSEAPRLEVHPSELEFPEISVGSSSSAVVTLANVGGGSPVVQEVDIIGDGFKVVDDDCTDQAVAESCTVEVGFEPEWSGESFGTITFRVGATAISGDLVAAASAPPSTSPPATTDTEPSIGDPLTTDPPPGTTSGTTASDAPAETDLQRCEREAKDAEVGFTPAADMVVGQLEDVVVRASVGELEITSGPVGGPPTTIVEVSLHCEVRAQLRGADFEIDPPEHQEASFLDEATIEWIWQVRPVRSGALDPAPGDPPGGAGGRCDPAWVAAALRSDHSRRRRGSIGGPVHDGLLLGARGVPARQGLRLAGCDWGAGGGMVEMGAAAEVTSRPSAACWGLASTAAATRTVTSAMTLP